MSRGLNNPKAFSTQDEAETSPITAPQITDATDFPHTGLIKALNLGMRGNYATTGFNATSVTDDDVTFADGVVFRDGEEVAVTGSTIVIGTTTGTTKSHTTGYHLVVNQTGTTTLTVRPPTTTNAVPAYNDDDVIIAILAYTGNTPMQIQYLTVNKSKNSVSIARSNSGTYTEMGTITADTNSLDIVTTNSNADIILDPHGTGDVKLGNLAIDGDQTVGSGQDGYALIYTHSNAKAALGAIPAAYTDADAISAVEGEATLDLTGDVTIAAGKDLTVDTNTLHVDSANNRVGVGTTSPDVDLDVKKSTTTIARVASTGSHANLRFGRANSSYDAAMLFYDDMATTPALQWRIQMTNGGSDLSIRDEDGSPDGQEIMKFKDGGGIDINCDVDIASGHDLTVDTNTLHVDAANNRVGIGTTTPSKELDVSGDIRLSGEIEINGDLNHDGSNVGFFGTTPASRQTVGALGSTHLVPIPPTNPSAPAGFEPTNEAYILGLESEVSALRTKISQILSALQIHGLIL